MKKGIVFIHGYMGSVKQFDGLKKRLSNAGADLIFHSVAGHDKTLADFLDSDDASWQSGLNCQLESLRGEYDQLLLVGHSMGGLMAVRAAVADPKGIKGIAAIGFPIKVWMSLEWIKNMVNAAHPEKPGEDPRITAARSMCGVDVRNFSDFVKTIPLSGKFLKLAKAARRELSGLKVPLEIINFEGDEIVAKKGAAFVKKQLPEAKIHMQKNSYHFLFEDRDEQEMADIILGML